MTRLQSDPRKSSETAEKLTLETCFGLPVYNVSYFGFPMVLHSGLPHFAQVHYQNIQDGVLVRNFLPNFEGREV